MTNCLWQFMWNTSQPLNHDNMAFLCTGRVEVVKTRWHFVVFIGTNSLFSQARLLLISCHNNKLFLFTELANIVVSLLQTPCLYCHEIYS